jgi:hypothetical protein
VTASKSIPREPPRDLKALGLDTAIGFMIRVKVFVAWLLIIGGGLMMPIGLLTVVATLASDKPTMPLSGAIVLAGTFTAQLVLGLWWRKSLKRSVARRRHALERGRCIRGVVESVVPAPGLSLAMGRLDRRFHITYEALDGTARKTSFLSPLGLASSWLEVGAAVAGLEDPETGDVLFPAELGLNVRFA